MVVPLRLDATRGTAVQHHPCGTALADALGRDSAQLLARSRLWVWALRGGAVHRAMKPLAMMVALTCVACGSPPTVRLHLPPTIDAARVTWSPTTAVRSATTQQTDSIEFVVTPGVVRFSHPDACPLSVTVKRGDALEATLSAWLHLPDELPQVGFGEVATLVVSPGCSEAKLGRIEWQGQGVEPQSEGYVVRVRMPSLEAATKKTAPHGDIMPISYAQRGGGELVGTWSGPGHAPVVIRTTVHAASRATGLPNVSKNQVVYLSGVGWRIVDRPVGSAARLVEHESATLFQPNHVGRWVLQRGAEAELSIHVGVLASTPLDCGRSGCHEAAAAAVADSPMTHAFEHRMLDAPDSASCWLGCHVVGEKGLHDEGFFDIADAMPGVSLKPPLPRALARATGVQCLNCHGSGRIPEPSARWAVLQVGVCATCHDAPPRYGHVRAWSESAMARSDKRAETREAGCKGCHTTAGFLGRATPSNAAPLGITCSACHAPHSAHGPRLLRTLPPPATLIGVKADGTTMLCAQCHSARSPSLLPESTAASVVLGVGAVEVATGSALAVKANGHATLEGGCMACHSHSAEEVERGQSHGFEARVGDCVTCHAGSELPTAASWAKATEGLSLGSHAKGAAKADLSSPAGRLTWNRALLLRDRAAWAHNPAFANQLLTHIRSSTGSR